MKHNLVLGGEGTIGKALCNYLVEKGEEVISLDLKTGFDIRTDDLTPYSNVDYVWFLAWDVGGAKFLNAPENRIRILKNNTLICERTFSFLEKHKLPFMFASSQLAAADTPYGITKLVGEQWSQYLEGQICRFWNVYGWETPGEKSHVIPDLILKGLVDKEITLMTNGEEERQFIYMDDCVKNMVHIRNTDVADVDITDGQWIKIKDIAKLIGHLLDVPVYLGKEKGYSNKIDPIEKDFLTFPTSLENGIKLIMERAQTYIREQKTESKLTTQF